MNRRDFSAQLIAAGLGSIATTLALPARAPGGTPIEGTHYVKLNQPLTVPPGKIEVIEFFWYGCPHCYHLEPQVNAWLKTIPQDVVFRRVHALPSPAWAAHAQIFYTLQAMGLIDKLHQKVFDAIHKDNIDLANPKSRDEWLARFWCAKEAVAKALGRGLVDGSKAVAVRQADRQTGVIKVALGPTLATIFPEWSADRMIAHTVRDDDLVVAISFCERDST